VGLLTPFTGVPRPGVKVWCCESCRKAALRHGHDTPGRRSDASTREQAQAASQLRLANEPAP